MNILLVEPPRIGAYRHILMGLKNAFETAGHTVYLWNGNERELQRYKPDIYLGCSGWFHPYPKWARDTYGTRVAFQVSPLPEEPFENHPEWPPLEDDKPDMVADQSPEFVFGYFTGHDIQYWRGWRYNYYIDAIGVPTAGDCTVYKPYGLNARYRTDLAFVGGYWPYKAINLDRFIVPLRRMFDIRIYGNTGWGDEITEIRDGEIPYLFS